MTFDEYQKLAARTLTASDGRSPELHLAIMAAGLTGEAGEVVELVKKHVGHGHALPPGKLEKELGDVLWYVAALTTLLDIESRGGLRTIQSQVTAGSVTPLRLVETSIALSLHAASTANMVIVAAPRAMIHLGLQDVLRWVSTLATMTDLDLQSIAEANIAKLKARYPDGFSHEASKARAEGIRKQKPVLYVGACVRTSGPFAGNQRAVITSEPVDSTGRWQLDFGEYREWWYPDEFEAVS